MERVAFLLEETGEQYRCLLNPESLVLRRLAGVTERRSAGGLIAGAELADDPLLLTGGGSTELELDLLFDVSLAGSTVTSENVRDLTGPLWDLAENTRWSATYGRPPLVRLVWGKGWNIPGIVTAVMERLEGLVGRRYGLFDYRGDPEAERVIVVMGAAVGAVEETVDRHSLA